MSSLSLPLASCGESGYDNRMHISSPLQLKQRLPLEHSEKIFIENSRQKVREILAGLDGRLAIVMGPCSIHDIPSALEYADRLKRLSREVEKSCLLIMRVYTEKPRTRLGWKGLLNDPALDGSSNIAQGIYQTRQLLLELAEREVPTAAEFVDPLAHLYFNDLLTWGCIGARTSESQPHRELASSLTIPIGFKNTTEGDVDCAINGVISARHPHSFLSIDENGTIMAAASQGNPWTHIVLRGSVERPNYDEASVRIALDKLERNELPLRVMIDCAHGNCNRQYLRQKDVFKNLINRIASGDHTLFGLMLESHLQAGNQSSLTDPCIDWETTEELILYAHSQLCSSISCC